MEERRKEEEEKGEAKPGRGRGAEALRRGAETEGANKPGGTEDTERRIDKSTEEPEEKSPETSAEMRKVGR